MSAVDDLLDGYLLRDALGYHDEVGDYDFDSDDLEKDLDYDYENKEWIR